MRAEITKYLIKNRGFEVVLCEADWPFMCVICMMIVVNEQAKCPQLCCQSVAVLPLLRWRERSCFRFIMCRMFLELRGVFSTIVSVGRTLVAPTNQPTNQPTNRFLSRNDSNRPTHMPCRYHINEYIHRKKMTMYPRGPKGVRFPQWMWKNTVFADLIEWMRAHANSTTKKVNLLGMDCYCKEESMADLCRFLEVQCNDRELAMRVRCSRPEQWPSLLAKLQWEDFEDGTSVMPRRPATDGGDAGPAAAAAAATTAAAAAGVGAVVLLPVSQPRGPDCGTSPPNTAVDGDANDSDNISAPSALVSGETNRPTLWRAGDFHCSGDTTASWWDTCLSMLLLSPHRVVVATTVAVVANGAAAQTVDVW